MNNEQGRSHGGANPEAAALLKYMADHSAHHAEELRELAESLPPQAAARVREAIALLNESAEKLLEALRETED